MKKKRENLFAVSTVAALNGAAFVGGYDEEVDVVFSDDDDEPEEKVSVPPMDEETEMKVSRWVENHRSPLSPGKCSYLSESEHRSLMMISEPKIIQKQVKPANIVPNLRISQSCVDKFHYPVSSIEVRMPISAPKSATTEYSRRKPVGIV